MILKLLNKNINFIMIIIILSVNAALVSSEIFINHDSKGALGDTDELKLQNGLFWTGHPEKFTKYHPSLSPDPYLGVRRCVKKTIIITHYTECFKRKKIKYHLEGSKRISNYVTCKENTTCKITPFKTTQFHPVIPGFVGQGLREYLQTTISLANHQPLYAQTKLSPSIQFTFRGPGTRAIFLNPLYSEITGEHEYFEVLGGIGERYAEDIRLLIPRRLKNGFIDGIIYVR